MSSAAPLSRPTQSNFQEEDRAESSMRPTTFQDFVGQRTLCKNLQTFIQATLKKDNPLDHVLLAGPPGLGKTTMAMLIANALDAQLHTTSGATIVRAGELAALLTNLKPRDVLFIDEIHRLNKTIEEILYPALEDRKLDLMVGEGPAARSVRLSLAPFTLIGATTRQGLLSRPLRDRFGILGHMTFYESEDLGHILTRAAQKMALSFAGDASTYLANRARGTPRIALRLLRRIHDFAVVQNINTLTSDFIEHALKELGIDHEGLDDLDRRYIQNLAHQFSGGPVGIETLASVLFEERDTLEDVVEPFLMQKGFLKRTPRGRVLGKAAYLHLNLPVPDENP